MCMRVRASDKVSVEVSVLRPAKLICNKRDQSRPCCPKAEYFTLRGWAHDVCKIGASRQTIIYECAIVSTLYELLGHTCFHWSTVNQVCLNTRIGGRVCAMLRCKTGRVKKINKLTVILNKSFLSRPMIR